MKHIIKKNKQKNKNENRKLKFKIVEIIDKLKNKSK